MRSSYELKKIGEVSGELNRLLIQYWHLLGKPPLSEFLSLLPIEMALEHIDEAGKGDYVYRH